jgi:hypothetical protein
LALGKCLCVQGLGKKGDAAAESETVKEVCGFHDDLVSPWAAPFPGHSPDWRDKRSRPVEKPLLLRAIAEGEGLNGHWIGESSPRALPTERWTYWPLA